MEPKLRDPKLNTLATKPLVLPILHRVILTIALFQVSHCKQCTASMGVIGSEATIV